MPDPDSLSGKMSRLLDRALDQNTRGSQVELYHHLLDQLVADEARILGALSDGSASPMVNVYSWLGPRVPGRATLENASLIGRTANVALPQMVPQYVGHLLSLGLVEKGPEDPALATEYEVLMAETTVLAAIKSASRGPTRRRSRSSTLSCPALARRCGRPTMQGRRSVSSATAVAPRCPAGRRSRPTSEPTGWLPVDAVRRGLRRVEHEDRRVGDALSASRIQGSGPFGWQGIVPRRAGKVGSKTIELLTSNLLNPKSYWTASTPTMRSRRCGAPCPGSRRDLARPRRADPPRPVGRPSRGRQAGDPVRIRPKRRGSPRTCSPR